MKKKTHLFIIGLTLLFGLADLKAQTLLPELQKLFGKENVVSVDSSAFKEYYKINVPQLIDHNDQTKGTFSNRILLGFNDLSAPVVMESAPYGFYKSQENLSYETELTQLFNANQIILEHRYFGKSIPDSTSFQYLTYEQTSEDFHYVRQAFSNILSDKWIATGTSKGGDAVLAYKFCYPNDVKATVPYVISMTLEAEDKRFEKFLKDKRKTKDGRKILEHQIYLLKNKKRLLPEFIHFQKSAEKFSNQISDKYDAETLFDFGVLEFEISFWQWYGNYEELKTEVNGTEKFFDEIGYKPETKLTDFQDKLIYLFDVSMPAKRMNAHYYQAFTQGGYYGYDEKPFKKYLKNKNYSLDIFAGEKTTFDNSFRLAEKKFAETEMENVMLILADTDPWSIVCPIPFPPNKDNMKLVLKNSNHGVKLKNFDKETQEKAIQKLTEWLNKSSH